MQPLRTPFPGHVLSHSALPATDSLHRLLLANLCLSASSDPGPGELPGSWGSMVFRHALISCKGRVTTTTVCLDIPQGSVLGLVLFSLFVNDLGVSLPFSASCCADGLAIGPPRLLHLLLRKITPAALVSTLVGVFFSNSGTQAIHPYSSLACYDLAVCQPRCFLFKNLLDNI